MIISFSHKKGRLFKGRRLFEGGKYFEIFPSKGGYYSREPIIRKALLFEEIRYLSSTVSSVCKGSNFK